MPRKWKRAKREIGRVRVKQDGFSIERLREPREDRQKGCAKCALLNARRGGICATGCWRGDDKPSLDGEISACTRRASIRRVGDPAAR